MLEQGIWVIFIWLAIWGSAVGITSTAYKEDSAERETLKSYAVNIGVAACIFALIGMWIY